MTSFSTQCHHSHPSGPVAVALGANLGDSYAILTAAVKVLDDLPGIKVKAQSHWYQTVAVGPPQPDYLNGCVLLQVDHQPEPLLQLLLQTESQFGRVRIDRWGPRTLDLDLLLYDQVMLETPTLTLPHPRLHERGFVLIPLAEILPNWQHPIYGQSIVELIKTVDCTGVRQLAE